MSAVKLTNTELEAIVIIERVGSSLSLIGCAWIVVTFLSSTAFRKPINRLVFYASLGNILVSIATLMSRSVLGDPSSALCQLQAALIQMFLSADAYWTLAMACNVYLTFFHKYDGEKLRAVEKYYCLICYGIPFVPALVYAIVTPSSGYRIYGDATLWCWVSKEYDYLRIATFYGPIWIVILVTIGIYVRAGKVIYERRKQLLTAHQPSTTMRSLNDPFESTKTMEVRITSEAIENLQHPIDVNHLGGSTASMPEHPFYSVTVSTNNPEDYLPSEYDYPLPPTPSPRYQIPSNGIPKMAFHTPDRTEPSRRRATAEANRAAFSYAKVAMLFFTAMVVTWTPSSANRVYSLVHPGYISPPLQFCSALVLPLQGFWNALIYTTTSWQATQNFLTGRLFQSVPKPVLVDRFSGVLERGAMGRGRGDRLDSVDRRRGELDRMAQFSGWSTTKEATN